MAMFDYILELFGDTPGRTMYDSEYAHLYAALELSGVINICHYDYLKTGTFNKDSMQKVFDRTKSIQFSTPLFWFKGVFSNYPCPLIRYLIMVHDNMYTVDFYVGPTKDFSTLSLQTHVDLTYSPKYSAVPFNMALDIIGKAYINSYEVELYTLYILGTQITFRPIKDDFVPGGQYDSATWAKRVKTQKTMLDNFIKQFKALEHASRFTIPSSKIPIKFNG